MASENKRSSGSFEMDEGALGKSGIEHHEAGIAPDDEMDAAMQKRITRKIDIRMLPLLILIYCFTFLDRVNIGNARLWNLERDLGMTGIQFNIVLLVFYIPYILFEVSKWPFLTTTPETEERFRFPRI